MGPAIFHFVSPLDRQERNKLEGMKWDSQQMAAYPFPLSNIFQRAKFLKTSFVIPCSFQAILNPFCCSLIFLRSGSPLILPAQRVIYGFPPPTGEEKKRTENRHRKCARVDDSMPPAGPAHQVEKTGITLKPFSTTLALSNNAAHKFVPPKCWNISIRRFASQSDLFIRHFRSTVRNWLKKNTQTIRMLVVSKQIATAILQRDLR